MERQPSFSDRIAEVNRCLPRAELILFTVQLSCVCFIIIFCLFALLLEVGPQNLWTPLLMTSIGYIMPGAGVKALTLDTKTIKESEPVSDGRNGVIIHRE